MDSTTEQLSSYAADLKYTDIPPEIVHQCKRRVIDTLGCAMGAFTAEPSKIVRAVAGMAVGDPPARVLGTQELSSVELATFANGVMMRYLDCNDAYHGLEAGHPSDTMAPVLTVSDAVHADGKTAITAIALAYEVFGSLCDSVCIRDKGWDHVCFIAPAAALGAGKVLQLAKEQMAEALALAITPNMATRQTREGELGMWKGCAAANASRNGVFAALLAGQGLTGSAKPIEGTYGLWDQVTGRFSLPSLGGRGAPFRIANTYLKYFPAEYNSQPAIWAALELRDKVKVEEIKSIAIDTYRMAWRIIGSEPEKWHPTTRETADHSLPYIFCAALIDGNITVNSFNEEHIRDPKLHNLMQKVTVRENPELTKLYPEAVVCRAETTTVSGQQIVTRVDYPKGHPKNPMTDKDVEEKFRRLSEGVLTTRQMGVILDRVWALDQVEDIGEIIELFVV